MNFQRIVIVREFSVFRNTEEDIVDFVSSEKTSESNSAEPRDSAQLSLPKAPAPYKPLESSGSTGPADRAMKGEKGGIDLTANKTPLEIKTGSPTKAFGDDKDGIKFNLDPAKLQQLQNAPGFVPVIINIAPVDDLRLFLGIQENSNIKQANVI